MIDFQSTWLEPRSASEHESYAEYLDSYDLLDDGFMFREIVAPDRRRDIPPRELWSRMVPTLGAANVFRKLCVSRIGLHGLRINAAYRKTGGANDSVHKVNGALDLDLLPGDADKTTPYYQEAVRFWCEYGDTLRMGLMLYCPEGRRGGVRIHIDTMHKCRTRQIYGHNPDRSIHYIRPSIALSIAKELGLTLPARMS